MPPDRGPVGLRSGLRDTTAEALVAIVETLIAGAVLFSAGAGTGTCRGRRGVVRLGMAVVRGRSMLPTLHDGDRLLVRYGARVRPGRLVVCRLPGRPGLAVKRATGRDGDAAGDGWWVERDNPDEGVDSWLVGAVPDGDVVATVLARAWPRPRTWRDRVPPAGGPLSPS